MILICKLDKSAIVPTKADPLAAGFDLFALNGCDIPPLYRCLVKTGISWSAPAGYYGLICGRSGLAYKKGLGVLGGVIDSNYRGDIGVILYNTSQELVRVESGDRIAQMIVHQHYSPSFVEVEALPTSDRGEKGFGSSGK